MPAADIERLTEKFTAVPEGFALHPTAKRVIEARKAMASGKQAIDWGMAETLAYASLVTKGHGVRISGEDSGAVHSHTVMQYCTIKNVKNGMTVLMFLCAIWAKVWASSWLSTPF